MLPAFPSDATFRPRNASQFSASADSQDHLREEFGLARSIISNIYRVSPNTQLRPSTSNYEQHSPSPSYNSFFSDLDSDSCSSQVAGESSRMFTSWLGERRLQGLSTGSPHLPTGQLASRSGTPVTTYEIGDISKEYLEKLALAYVMSESRKGHEITPQNIVSFLRNFQKVYPHTLNQYLNKCQFCLRNGSNIHCIDHALKDAEGNVVCPVLFSYVCSICKATGPKAHTWKYCPFNPYTNGDPVTAGMKPGRFQGRT